MHIEIQEIYFKKTKMKLTDVGCNWSGGVCHFSKTETTLLFFPIQFVINYKYCKLTCYLEVLLFYSSPQSNKQNKNRKGLIHG